MLLITLQVLLALFIVVTVFILGARWGGKVWSDELIVERKAKAAIVADRDKALAVIQKVRAAANSADPEVRRLFPFL